MKSNRKKLSDADSVKKTKSVLEDMGCVFEEYVDIHAIIKSSREKYFKQNTSKENKNDNN